MKSVDNSAKNGIINTYSGKPLLQKNNNTVSQKTVKKIQDSLDTIVQDFKGLRDFITDVSFDKINDIALNKFSIDNCGNIKNEIVFDLIWFSDEKNLLEKLRQDYIDGKNYETGDIRSLVAHEIGHAAHNLLALRRSGWEQGEQLKRTQLVLFEQERNKIIQECYIQAFDDEDFNEIKTKKYLELGNMTKLEIELISQSFGNYFFGKNRSQIASAIVDFFKKELK